MATDLNNSRPRTRRSRKYHRNGNMKITIESNKTLLDILDDKRKVLKLLIIIIVLAMTIFIGLSFVTVSIKSVYPYNSIRVNAFGTTTMQDDDREIHYWLFNTAELWANSGIYVEKGDKLTIRSSGKYNTAIHHMVNAADSNKINSDWIGPDGHEKDSDRGKLRAEFRIKQDQPVDAIIMLSIPIDSIQKYKNGTEYFRKHYDKIKDDIFFIGKECVDLQMRESGYLHFAVNDIFLSKDVIKKMRERNDSLIKDAIERQVMDALQKEIDCYECKNGSVPDKQKINTLLKKINSIESTNGRQVTKQKVDALLKKYPIDTKAFHNKTDSFFKDEKTWRNFNAKFLDFGPYPGQKEITKDCNEMTYYKDSGYYNAWFDDNLGSFLIVIEHKKDKP